MAFKVEPLNAEDPLLQHEYRIYQQLQNLQGFPVIEWFGVDGNHLALGMELLGPSLESHFQREGTFVADDVRCVGQQAVRISQFTSHYIIIWSCIFAAASIGTSS